MVPSGIDPSSRLIFPSLTMPRSGRTGGASAATGEVRPRQPLPPASAASLDPWPDSPAHPLSCSFLAARVQSGTLPAWQCGAWLPHTTDAGRGSARDIVRESASPSIPSRKPHAAEDGPWPAQTPAPPISPNIPQRYSCASPEIRSVRQEPFPSSPRITTP